MRIVPLSSVPHHASQITDWLWQAFGDGTSRAFYDSIVRSSLNGAAFRVTFVALDDDDVPHGTVGFWRCDLISRQDLYPWVAVLYVDEAPPCSSTCWITPASAAMKRCGCGRRLAATTSVSAGSISVMRWCSPMCR